MSGSTTSDEWPKLFSAIQTLARGNKKDTTPYLAEVETHATIQNTRVTSHCYSLTLDGNGNARFNDFIAWLALSVTDFAIPREDIAAARLEFDRSGSTASMVKLARDARKLFTKLPQSGEGGELLLFALAERCLSLPQLMCKMSLKTNEEMHVHGSDGLHAGVDKQTGKLVLYWGESKIYSDPTAAIRECLRSLAPMVKRQTDSRDLQLLQKNADLGDQELEKALKAYLDPDSSDFLNLEYRGLCLIGFDYAEYPNGPGKITADLIASILADVVPSLKTQIQNRVETEDLAQVGMHFLCLPLPSVELFRSRLREELGLAPLAPAPATGAPATGAPATGAPATGTPTGTPTA